MASRRSFIAGLLATGLAPKQTWADAGNPAFLSAGLRQDGAYVLCGLSTDGQITFERALPARGHAAAAHPTLPEAVVFARRPGTYALVLDCTNGHEKARLEAPAGRHFYGHGTFSADGELLFTTENDYGNARGIVGVWDARHGYGRLTEFWSGGIGPHDIKLMPDGQTLVIANGGIETHPDTGRSKLNISTMRSNLSYLTLNGTLAGDMALGPKHQRNSMRHLAVSQDGAVAFAMQWQGDLSADLSLLGIHRREADQKLLVQDVSVRRMRGYLGSIAYDDRTQTVATTSPRSGTFLICDAAGIISETSLDDVCGVAVARDSFVVTTGVGRVQHAGKRGTAHAIAWDNHLINI